MLSKEQLHMLCLTDVSLEEIQSQNQCGRGLSKCGYWHIVYCKLCNNVQLSVVFLHSPVCLCLRYAKFCLTLFGDYGFSDKNHM